MITTDIKTEFKSRVAEWARGVGFEIEEIRIRPMKNKWSSCSENGRLSFTPALLEQSEEFQREIVLRETLSLSRHPGGRMARVFLKAFGFMQSATYLHSPSSVCHS